MDSVTHLYVANFFLEKTDSNIGASIYSLLPIIDRKPPHFHRLFGHCIINFPEMLQIAIDIISQSKNINNNNLINEKKIYIHQRLNEEFSDMKKLCSNIQYIDKKKLVMFSKNFDEALLALMSHIYIDVFNNPVQVFVPNSVYCSGQWDFWKEIDFNYFRKELYKEEKLHHFWKDLIEMDINIERKFSKQALVQAQMIRLGQLSIPLINHTIIKDFLSLLKINESQEQIFDALDFCLKFENNFKHLIKKNVNDIYE